MTTMTNFYFTLQTQTTFCILKFPQFIIRLHIVQHISLYKDIMLLAINYVGIKH